MKVVVGAMLALLVLGCAGGLVLLGVIPVRRTPSASDAHAVPPLQSLPAQTTDNHDMVVTLSERYLNRQLTKNMPQDGAATDVRLDLHEGNTANVSATIQLNSLLTVQPNASLKFNVVNGRITIEVTQVDVGGFGVPSSLIEPQITQVKANAESELNRQLADLQMTTGLKLQVLSTTENSLTLYFAA